MMRLLLAAPCLLLTAIVARHGKQTIAHQQKDGKSRKKDGGHVQKTPLTAPESNPTVSSPADSVCGGQDEYSLLVTYEASS